MAKHVISVCIFCFICATHSPCASHAEVTSHQHQHGHQHGLKSDIKGSNQINHQQFTQFQYESQLDPWKKHDNKKLYSTTTSTSTPPSSSTSSSTSSSSLKNPPNSYQRVKLEKTDHQNQNKNKIIRRKKRDTHAHLDLNKNNNNNNNKIITNKNAERIENEDEYLHKIFKAFGDGKHMTIEGFQKLLRRLDLMETIKSSMINDQHNNLTTNTKGSKERTKIQVQEQEDININYNNNDNNNKTTCLDQELLVKSVRDRLSAKQQQDQLVDNETIRWVCPALLYRLLTLTDSGKCGNTEGSIEEEDMVLNFDDSDSSMENMKWFYSMLAVIVISACGLLGLAVIPVMNKSFYQPLLQFLVALAVGTLAGDALLHLLPHAMGGDHHSDSGEGENQHKHEFVHVAHVHHDDKMWKGFTAMLGLLFFFLMERLITLCAKWRKSSQLKEKMPSRLKIMKSDGNPPQNPVEKQCKHKYSSFPMCYDEIAMLEGQNDDIVVRLAGGTDSVENNTATTTIDDLGSNSEMGSLKLAGSHLSQHNHINKLEANQNSTECSMNDGNNVNNCTEVNKMLEKDTEKDDTGSVEYTVILREHENRHHGHSHTHGHVHSAPKNMSAVVWMVVMGDGLHNFTDGMAIGAAFASSIAGGFSTAVAVLCHELPHELGDFAVLLKAGMTLKQALFYNLLSSVLCLFGNMFGLWVGATETASQWIFAVAAGMFLYIALVDMIPELSSGHKGEGTLLQCVLHLGGLLMGFGIMTFIALYEHDLKNIFHDA